MLGYQYWKTRSLRVVRTRAFNHTGPGQGTGFVAPSFALQLALIESGRRPPTLRVGNLDSVRDFCDVRDVARAYDLALAAGEPGEVYNVASGIGVSIATLLDTLLSMVAVDVQVESEPGRHRPADIPTLIGDAGRLRRRTGWEPGIPLRRTLEDLLDDARARVAAGEGVSG